MKKTHKKLFDALHHLDMLRDEVDNFLFDRKEANYWKILEHSDEAKWLILEYLQTLLDGEEEEEED